MFGRRYRRLLPAIVLPLLAACGGGGSGANPPPPPPPPPAAEPSFINLISDAGDYIGAGGNYSYSNADAVLTVTAIGARLRVVVEGDESWTGDFQLPDTYDELQSGSYLELQRYPFHDPAVGGLSWTGEGRGCNTLTGWLVIDDVTYEGSTLTAIDLQFEQHCEGGAPALHGEIHWDAEDATSPPGPVTPPPAGLWEPAPGITPASGNYVYLESQPGNFVGGGGNYLYTHADSVINVNAAQNRVAVSITGDESWDGDFQAMHSLSRLEAGYYGDLERYPFHNPVKGGLNWSGEGGGCNTLTGWFVVDSVAYDGLALTAIDLRFEQQCDGDTSALRGEIHWDANDTTGPPGPVVPPPTGLWEPAPGITPASGNYVYLESQPGDYIGGGGSYLYTQADSLISIFSSGPYLNVEIDGDENWDGDFEGMYILSRLEVGYYGDLERYPFNNPVKGGLSWYGDGRGCNTLNGWFVVDNVIYDGQLLTAIDLRFEQHCEGGGPALHGEIHWDINDTTGPPGPVVPPPAGLWAPAPGITPASGNYVYLESQPGDYIGAGGSYLYTLADSQITGTVTGARVTVSVNGDENWNGDFQAMNSLSRLEVGYYGDLERFPFHNPVKGGLSWSGEGRGCNTLTGWFVVDSVTYDGLALTAIDLRFEQHCEGGGPALRGAIRWDVDDIATPPGPVVPPPAGLWAPAPGITPASGNYVYLESQPGDYIGAGLNYLYVPADSLIAAFSNGTYFNVTVDGDESWNGDFQGMDSLSRLEVGYYGDLQRYPFHNPVKGGLSWYGEGRGCGSLTGWFVVDDATYDGVVLTSITLRFEQHCDGSGPALRGAIRWSQ